MSCEAETFSLLEGFLLAAGIIGFSGFCGWLSVRNMWTERG